MSASALLNFAPLKDLATSIQVEPQTWSPRPILPPSQFRSEATFSTTGLYSSPLSRALTSLIQPPSALPADAGPRVRIGSPSLGTKTLSAGYIRSTPLLHSTGSPVRYWKFWQEP